nr:MAG TPA: hypothetical protein [Caudoviricetes sp.]
MVKSVFFTRFAYPFATRLRLRDNNESMRFFGASLMWGALFF